MMANGGLTHVTWYLDSRASQCLFSCQRYEQYDNGWNEAVSVGSIYKYQTPLSGYKKVKKFKNQNNLLVIPQIINSRNNVE